MYALSILPLLGVGYVRRALPETRSILQQPVTARERERERERESEGERPVALVLCPPLQSQYAPRRMHVFDSLLRPFEDQTSDIFRHSFFDLTALPVQALGIPERYVPFGRHS